MILNKIGYSYNDLTIIPSQVSYLDSRSQADPFNAFKYLPIFTAPMSTVVNTDNFYLWKQNHIYSILPRNIDFETRKEYLYKGELVAVSLKESEKLFISENYDGHYPAKVCIDIANGHMAKLLELCYNIKQKYKNKVMIMTGNIANPETILLYEKAGIDYVRCSIGSGSGCITSSNTGIHYPIASLIDECYQLKRKCSLKVKIIADGGIRNYSDVIKAIALGADYVMIGSLFAGLKESAAPISESGNKIFYGMASKEGQIDINGKVSKTAEGIRKEVPIIGTLQQWSKNMQDYFKSALSYCGVHNLTMFKGKVDLIINSSSEINSVNK